MTIADWIEQQQISQREAARRFDVAPSTLCRILHGARQPSVALISRICHVTGGAVTPNDIVSTLAPTQDAA